jgi:hypothetical protein
LVYYDSEQIPLADQVDKIKEVVKRRSIQLIIIDSASLATGESTSDEKSVIRLMSALKLLRTTTLLIAHQRKNDGEKTPIGSIQFENQARNVWNFKKEIDENDQRTLHLACTHTKANNTYLRREPLCYKVIYLDDKIEIIPEAPQNYYNDKLPVSDRIKQALDFMPGLSVKDIAEQLGVTPNSISKNLSRGKDRGIFTQLERGKWVNAELPEKLDL